MTEIANPETGAMTDEQAVAMLAARRAPVADDKPQPDEAPEAVEVDTEETEGAAAAEVDEPDAETEPEEQEEEQPKYRVKIDGREVEVTLDEALKGYQRDADYRRKTQAVADERRQMEAQRQQLEQLSAQLAQALESTTGDEKEPDWLKLSREMDPWEFQQKRTEWEHKQRIKAEAKARHERVTAMQRLQRAQEEGARLREIVPEWSDPARFRQDWQALESDAAKFYGFKPAELGEIMDHRELLVLRDAAAYRAMKAKNAAVEKRVAQAPKVTKPGAAPAPKAVQAKADLDAIRDRLKRRGSDDDAVALLRARRMK